MSDLRELATERGWSDLPTRLRNLSATSSLEFPRLADDLPEAPGSTTGDDAGPAEVAGALGRQVNGSHYKDLPIQPVEFIHKNGIDFLAGNAIKYLVRHSKKGGAADIRKARHYCDLILKLQYGEDA